MYAEGRRREMVARPAVTLKMLAYPPAGPVITEMAIAATRCRTPYDAEAVWLPAAVTPGSRPGSVAAGQEVSPALGQASGGNAAHRGGEACSLARTGHRAHPPMPLARIGESPLGCSERRAQRTRS
jgi:hypothetical protein